MASRKEKTPAATPGERGEPGRIARITIAGFKSIADQTLHLGRLNVLIGANASGKTALLEAIGLLGAASVGRVDTGELARRGVRPSAPRLLTTALSDTRARSIRLEAVAVDGARYAVTLMPPREGAWPALWRFQAETVAVGREVVFQRKGRAAQVRGPRGRWREAPDFGAGVGGAARAIPPSGDGVRELLFSLADAVIYDPKTPELRGVALDPFDREPLGLHGGGLARAMRALQREDGGLGPLGRDDLLGLLHWAAGVDIGRPDMDVAAPSVPMTNEIIRFVDRRMSKERHVISAFDASEGALYVLFALTLLFHPHTPRLFSVEGLDHALHPRLARALMRTLGEHVGAMKKQVVLTTHNPLVLDGLDLANDEIRLFTVDRAESGETVVRRVEYTEALRMARESGATLSQMWLQGLLGAVPDLW